MKFAKHNRLSFIALGAAAVCGTLENHKPAERQLKEKGRLNIDGK